MTVSYNLQVVGQCQLSPMFAQYVERACCINCIASTWPDRRAVAPRAVYACYCVSRAGIAAWSMMCTGYIVILCAVALLHTPFDRLHQVRNHQTISISR
jgi:hypothetical protein